MGQKSKSKAAKRDDSSPEDQSPSIKGHYKAPLLPKGYLPSEDSYSFSPTSFFNLEVTKRERKRLTTGLRKFPFNSEVYNSRVVRPPTLELLPVGYNLADAYRFACCLESKFSWNGRAYAHQLTTEFSGQHICKNSSVSLDQPTIVGDWANMKSLFKAAASKSRLSFLVHTFDEVVTIDHLDLPNVLILENYLELPPDFLQFVRDYLKDSLVEIQKGGKSNKEILAKEAYHKLIHGVMKTPFYLGTKDTSYLRYATLLVGQLRILVGSNVPVYWDDEQNYCTVLANEDEELSELEAFDLWLDNTIHGCSESYVFTQKNWTITTVTSYSTAQLAGKCDIFGHMDIAERILSGITDRVRTGRTYWLYRHPGNDEINMICVSRTMKKGNSVPVFGFCPRLKKYTTCFQAAQLADYFTALRDVITQNLITELGYCKMNPAAVANLEKSRVNVNTTFLDQVQGCHNVAAYSRADFWAKLIQSPEEISVSTMPTVVACLRLVRDNLRRLEVEKTGWYYVNAFFPSVRRLHQSMNSAKRVVGRDTRLIAAFLKSYHDLISLLLECLAEVSELALNNENETADLWHYFKISLNSYLAQVSSQLQSHYEASEIPEDYGHERVTKIYLDILDYIDTVPFPLTVPQDVYPKRLPKQMVEYKFGKKLIQSLVAHAIHALKSSSVNAAVSNNYEVVVEKVKMALSYLSLWQDSGNVRIHLRTEQKKALVYVTQAVRLLEGVVGLGPNMRVNQTTQNSLIASLVTLALD